MLPRFCKLVQAPLLLWSWGSPFSASLLTRSVVKRPLLHFPVGVPDFQPHCLRAAWLSGPLLLWSRGSPCRPLRVISGMGDLVETTLTFIQPIAQNVNYIYILPDYLSSSTAKRLMSSFATDIVVSGSISHTVYRGRPSSSNPIS